MGGRDNVSLVTSNAIKYWRTSIYIFLTIKHIDKTEIFNCKIKCTANRTLNM